MRNNNIFVTCLFLIASSFLWGQEKLSFSLADAKEYALEHNFTLKNADLATESSIARKREILGMGLPQVGFTGSFNNFINLPVQVVSANFINPNAPADETISFRAGTTYSANGTLQVNQLLFNGSYLVGLQVAKLFVDFQKTLATQNQEDVVFNVIQAYQIAAVGKENLVFADSMVNLTKNLVDKQKNYLDLGLMKQDDYDQLAYSLLMAQNAKLEAENQYQNALTLLKMTMGYPVEKSISITDQTASLILRSNLGSSSIENNMSIMVLEQQRLLNTYNLRNMQAGKLPTLNAFFQHQYNAYRNSFNFFANEKWFPSTLWGLQLSIPIYTGGQKDAQIKQAQILLQQNDNSLLQLKESLKFQEAQAKNNLASAKQRLELQQANIDLAKKLYENSLIRKEIGQESSLNVTQKYNQMIQAQAQYAGAQIAVLNAKLELEKLYNQILTTNK